MTKPSASRLRLELLCAVLTAAALLAGLFAAGFHLMPHRYDYGAVWESYLEEERNTIDVLCFGSSICYCDFAPGAFYERSGLTSFVMAGPEQTPEVMYYYVREACRTQHPQYIFAEITGAFFPETTGFSQINVGYMPLSLNRIGAGRACEDGMLRLALFPIYDFHSELTAPQLPPSSLSAQDGRMLCGYTELHEVKTGLVQKEREGLHLPGTDAYEGHARALERLAAFCQEKGITLICYFAPAMEVVPASARETLTARLAQAGVTVWDLSLSAPEMGVDDETDWYDFLHFNQSGAEKFTAFLADRLLALGAKPYGTADAALWQQRADYLKD